MLEATEIQERLKQKGLRITPQRYAVYANLLGRNDHPTVEQIMSAINQDMPIASTASTYGALNVLREVGLIREVLLEEGITRYDANIDAHHHFVCEKCGAIQDLDWQAFQLPTENLPSGIVARSYEVTVKGLCDRCH